MTNLTNKQLIPYIEKAQSTKDRASFLTLYQQTFLPLYSFLYHYLDEDQNATQDVIMEAYYLAFDELNTLTNKETFRIFLNQIAFRLAYLKKTKQNFPHTYTKETLPTAIDKELRYRYNLITQKHNSDHIVILHYHCGLCTSDIETLLNLSQIEVYNLLKEGKERYQGVLKVNKTNKAKMEHVFETEVNLKEELIILKWIFVTCNLEPLNITQKEYLDRQNQTTKDTKPKKRVSLFNLLTSLFLILFVAFYLIEPRITLTKQQNYQDDLYLITIQNILPTKDIQASIQGETLPLTQISNKQYLLQPKRNGLLKVKMTLINNHSATKLTYIHSIDEVPPTIQYNIQNETLELTFLDDQSGVDFSTLQLTNSTNEPITPHTINQQTNTITLDLPTEPIHVSIQDHNGNTLIKTLKPSAD